MALFLECFLSYRFEYFETNETEWKTEWKELPGCQNVTRTECDFSSAITKYYDKHHVRIRAERREELSPWSSIFEMIPYFIGMSSIYTVTFSVKLPSAHSCGKMCVVSIADNNKSWCFSQLQCNTRYLQVTACYGSVFFWKGGSILSDAVFLTEFSVTLFF